MRVYKLFSIIDGELASYGAYGSHQITYTPRVRIEHPYMFAFHSEEEARVYAAYISGATRAFEGASLWECETDRWYPCPVKILNVYDIEDLCEAFWSRKLDGTIPLVDTPKGTVLIHDVVLKRRIV